MQSLSSKKSFFYGFIFVILVVVSLFVVVLVVRFQLQKDQATVDKKEEVIEPSEEDISSLQSFFTDNELRLIENTDFSDWNTFESKKDHIRFLHPKDKDYSFWWTGNDAGINHERETVFSIRIHPLSKKEEYLSSLNEVLSEEKYSIGKMTIRTIAPLEMFTSTITPKYYLRHYLFLEGDEFFYIIHTTLLRELHSDNPDYQNFIRILSTLSIDKENFQPDFSLLYQFFSNNSQKRETILSDPDNKNQKTVKIGYDKDPIYQWSKFLVSPTGRYLIRWNEYHIYISSSEDIEKFKEILTIVGPYDSIADLFFFPNDEKLLYVIDHSSSPTQDYESDREISVYSINTDGTEKKLIRAYPKNNPRSLKLHGVNPERNEFYWAEMVDGGYERNFAIANLSDGQSKEIKTALPYTWLVGLSSPKVSNKNSSLYFTTPRELFEYSLETQEKRLLYTFSSVSSFAGEEIPWGFQLTPQEDQIVFLDNEKYYRLNLADGKIQPFFENLKSEENNFSSFRWSPDGQYLWLQTSNGYFIADIFKNTLFPILAPLKDEYGNFKDSIEFLGWVSQGSSISYKKEEFIEPSEEDISSLPPFFTDAEQRLIQDTNFSDWDVFESKKDHLRFLHPKNAEYSFWTSENKRIGILNEIGINHNQETVFSITAYPLSKKEEFLSSKHYALTGEKYRFGKTAIEGIGPVDTLTNTVISKHYFYLEEGEFFYIIYSSLLREFHSDLPDYQNFIRILSTLSIQDR